MSKLRVDPLSGSWDIIFKIFVCDLNCYWISLSHVLSLRQRLLSWLEKKNTQKVVWSGSDRSDRTSSRVRKYVWFVVSILSSLEASEKI